MENTIFFLVLKKEHLITTFIYNFTTFAAIIFKHYIYRRQTQILTLKPPANCQHNITDTVHLYLSVFNGPFVSYHARCRENNMRNY